MDLDYFLNPKPDMDPPKRLEDKLGFGKYRDWGILYVLEADPEYMIWVYENTDCKLEGEVVERIKYEIAKKERFCYPDDDLLWSDFPF